MLVGDSHNYDSACLPPWHIQQIIGYAAKQGVGIEGLVAGLSFTEQELADPEFRVSFRQTYEFVRHAFEYFDRRLLGAEVANGLRPSSFGLVGAGISASPDVENAAQFSIQNRLHFGAMMHIEFAGTDQACCLNIAPIYPADDLLVYLCDRFASATLSLLRVLMKNAVSKTCVSFPYSRQASLSRFSEEFGCQVKFDQPRFTIALDTLGGDTALASADHILWSQIATTLAKVAPQARHEAEVVVKVRRYIQANLGEIDLNVAQVAASLFMSERTLRRRLKECDTSFRNLIAQEREQRARELMGEGKLSMTDIAVICGYADSSSLRRCLAANTN